MTTSSSSSPAVATISDGCSVDHITSGGMSTLRRLLSDILQSLQLPTSTTSAICLSANRRKDATMFSTAGERFCPRESVSNRLREPPSAAELYMNRFSTADVYERALEVLLENGSFSVRDSPANWFDDDDDDVDSDDRQERINRSNSRSTATQSLQPEPSRESGHFVIPPRSRSPGSDVESILDAMRETTETYMGDVTLRRVFSLEAEVLHSDNDVPTASRFASKNHSTAVGKGGIRRRRRRRSEQTDNLKTIFGACTMRPTGSGCSTNGECKTWTLPLAKKLTSTVGDRLTQALNGLKINQLVADLPRYRRAMSRDNNSSVGVDSSPRRTEGSRRVGDVAVHRVKEMLNGDISIVSDRLDLMNGVGCNRIIISHTNAAAASAPNVDEVSHQITVSEESLFRVPSSLCSVSTQSTAAIRTCDGLQPEDDSVVRSLNESEMTSSSCFEDDGDDNPDDDIMCTSGFSEDVFVTSSWKNSERAAGHGVITGSDLHTIGAVEIMKYVITSQCSTVASYTNNISQLSNKHDQNRLTDGPVFTEIEQTGNENCLPTNRPRRSVIDGVKQRRRDSAPAVGVAHSGSSRLLVQGVNLVNGALNGERKPNSSSKKNDLVFPFSSNVDLRHQRLKLLRECSSNNSRTSSCEVVVGDTERDSIVDFRLRTTANFRQSPFRHRPRERRNSWCSISSASMNNDDDLEPDDVNVEGDDGFMNRRESGIRFGKTGRCFRSSSVSSVLSATFGSETESACDAARDQQRDFLFDSLLIDRLRRMRDRRCINVGIESGDEAPMTSSYCEDAVVASTTEDDSDVDAVQAAWPCSMSCSSGASSTSCSSVDAQDNENEGNGVTSDGGHRRRSDRKSHRDEVLFLSLLGDDFVVRDTAGESLAGESPEGRDRIGCQFRKTAKTAALPDNCSVLPTYHFRSHQFWNGRGYKQDTTYVPAEVPSCQTASIVDVLTAPLFQTPVADVHRATTSRIPKFSNL